MGVGRRGGGVAAENGSGTGRKPLGLSSYVTRRRNKSHVKPNTLLEPNARNDDGAQRKKHYISDESIPTPKN